MLIDHLHPMLVHFPIALLVAAFVFDLAGLVTRRPSFSSAALYTSVMGAVGAIAAYVSGNQAEEGAERLAGIEAVLERHEDLGKLLVAVALAVLAVRVVVHWRGWKERFGAQALVTALSLVVVFVVGATGFYGGQLVYDHGAGVAPVMSELPPGPAEHGEADEH